ncbi:MAG: class I SAM-dependent methyltransferase, partial [Pseudomonadota bacterium]
CGPLREVFDVFHRFDDATSLEVVAMDIDPRALEFAQRQAQAAGVASRVRFVHADLMAVADQAIDLIPQDMIYSVGLVDYFDDPSVVRLLDWIYDRLALGGRALLGNFHPCNPDRALMDYVLEWRLTHRTEADMNHLFQASRFAAPCTRILFEAEGINLFAEGVRS